MGKTKNLALEIREKEFLQQTTKQTLIEQYNEITNSINKKFTSILRPINKTILIGKYVNDIDGNCLKITNIEDKQIIGNYYRNPATVAIKADYISTESKVNLIEIFDNQKGKL